MTSQKTAGGRPPEADGRTGPRPETGVGTVPRDHGRALLRPVVAFALLAAVALVLGVWSLTRVDPGKISDVGLISAFPPTYYVALALSLVGFVGSVRLRRLLPALLAWQLVVLVVILHGADPIVHGLPRLEASYRHLGIADYIAQSGHLDPPLDAYFNWPGFFGLLGMVADATGVHDLTALATWAPLGVNLLLMPALVALAARLTNNRRQAWTGIWLFYLASWVGQDYLSPQAYALLLLFTLLACVLTVFDGWAWPANGGRFRIRLAQFVTWLDPTRLKQRLHPPRGGTTVLMVACILLLTAITATHQLTPFAAFPMLVAMLLIGRCRLPILPVLALALPVLWLLFVATPYLVGHVDRVFGSFGDIGAIASASVIDRVSGSWGHQLVVYIRLGETVAIWGLAVLGAVVGRVRRSTWLAAAAGLTAPFVLVPAQSYGGELLIRIYLFGLPFAACLIALPLIPRLSGPLGWRRSIALLLLGSVLASATLVARYGNDSLENFTHDEIALVDQLYAVAPAGAVLIEAVHDTPWRFERYAAYQYRSLLDTSPRSDADPLTCSNVDRLVGRRIGYLLVTRSQVLTARLIGIGPAGGVESFVATCRTSPGWSVVYQNSGGVLLRILGAGHA